jgi:hypothetical protein
LGPAPTPRRLDGIATVLRQRPQHPQRELSPTPRFGEDDPGPQPLSGRRFARLPRAQPAPRAGDRAGLVDTIDAPAHPAAPQDLANPQRFLGTTDLTVCGELTSVGRKYADNPTVRDWAKSAHSVPASQWDPQQKSLNDAVAPLMLDLADDVWSTVQRSGNPTIQDFGALVAQYQRAFAKALPTYTFLDDEINGVAEYGRYVLRDSCAAIGA